MNYILVSSTAAQSGHQRVDFRGPTYIDYYAENNAVTLLEAQLKHVLMAVESPRPTVHQQMVHTSTVYPQQMPPPTTYFQPTKHPLTPSIPPRHKLSYNYTVKLPPLAVLEFLKQHGYKVVGTNTIGDTCIWTLEKQTGTTAQSTPQTDAAI